MLFVVNSTVKFYTKTLPICVESLRAAGATEIMAIIGGDQHKYFLKDNVEYTFVPYENFDLTSFIHISDQPRFKDFFYLHDTCKAGPNFLNKLRDIHFNPNHCAKVACDGLSMNIGYYPFAFVKKYEADLQALKNTDITEEGRHKAKLIALAKEDFIFKSEPTGNLSKEGRCTTNDAPYEGSTRIQEYYPSLDLYKYKANYNLAKHPLNLNL